jgi:hypothetical protein
MPSCSIAWGGRNCQREWRLQSGCPLPREGLRAVRAASRRASGATAGDEGGAERRVRGAPCSEFRTLGTSATASSQKSSGRFSGSAPARGGVNFPASCICLISASDARRTSSWFMVCALPCRDADRSYGTWSRTHLHSHSPRITLAREILFAQGDCCGTPGGLYPSAAQRPHHPVFIGDSEWLLNFPPCPTPMMPSGPT